MQKTLTNEELKEVYALYKQATCGDVNIDKPGIADIKYWLSLRKYLIIFICINLQRWRKVGGLEFQERNGFRDCEEGIHWSGGEDERETRPDLESFRSASLSVSDQHFIFQTFVVAYHLHLLLFK